MFGRPSLRELLRSQHEEFIQYQEKRDEEFLARNEEFREFNREILLRNEKIYTALIAEMEEGRKQIQANTKAVLSMLDRFEGSGGIAA